ncbi:MAG: glycosyltransferase family 2 protein [Candidatus Omnitrophota bacterium]|jgi:glycosyltransferase involved in cell wall biosynthesis
MKLVIQIPCLNEEKTLPLTLRSIPQKIDGIDEVEILIIDDGSSDGTLSAAKENGATHAIRFNRTIGLARAFKAGIEEALIMGADIIVNTDADNQYDGACIRDLVKPILDKKADIVIGNREILKGMKQGITKSTLQWLGSRVVSKLSGINISDATSGFRAFSREAVLALNISTDFSYTLESIIQAGEKGLVVSEVPVKTNKSIRKSRLFKNNLHYIKRSVGTLIKVYVAYEGFRVFLASGIVLFLSGVMLVFRYLYFYIFNLNPGGHVQSLIIASVLITVGILIMVLGLLAELICSTRRLIEDELKKLKKP